LLQDFFENLRTSKKKNPAPAGVAGGPGVQEVATDCTDITDITDIAGKDERSGSQASVCAPVFGCGQSLIRNSAFGLLHSNIRVIRGFCPLKKSKK
jgi:hypothetical protein